MANEHNLRSFTSEQSHDECVKNGRKGGLATQRKRRELKTMREQIEILMKLPVTNVKLKEDIEKLGVDTSEINMQMVMNVALMKRAMQGDVRAYEMIRDTKGEKPVEQIQTIEPPKIVMERPKD